MRIEQTGKKLLSYEKKTLSSLEINLLYIYPILLYITCPSAFSNQSNRHSILLLHFTLLLCSLAFCGSKMGFQLFGQYSIAHY